VVVETPEHSASTIDFLLALTRDKMEDLQMGFVQPPSGGLIGYSNYNLYSNCENLTGVSITVDVTEEMIAVPSAPAADGSIQSNGIGFQLNCLPRAGGDITWQQYIMVVSRTGEDLRWGINNWNNDPAYPDGIINQGGDLATLPSSLGSGYASIPAGYRLQITLGNDSSDNINEATFSMYDQNGAPVFTPNTVKLLSLTDVNGNPITAAELSPIVDIDFLIVGYANRADTTLSQGAGTITYQASNALTVLDTFPPCTAGVNTGESSNVTYGVLDASSAVIVQTFQAPPPGVASVTASSPILWTGSSDTCTVTLNQTAPTEGTPVTLSLAGEYGTGFSGVNLSTSVLEIGGGATQGSFQVIASATAWGALTITAAGLDGVDQSTSVLVVAGQITLSIDTASPKSGQPVAFTVYVRTPAPSSGGQITLTATNAINIVVSGMPSSIPLGAGATSAQFTLVPTSSRAVGSVTITATYEGNSASTVVTLDSLHITPPRIGGKFPV
jgi:hypothetical protein